MAANQEVALNSSSSSEPVPWRRLEALLQPASELTRTCKGPDAGSATVTCISRADWDPGPSEPESLLAGCHGRPGTFES
eukprot:2254657-Rhodomonas_salina.2